MRRTPFRFRLACLAGCAGAASFLTQGRAQEVVLPPIGSSPPVSHFQSARLPTAQPTQIAPQPTQAMPAPQVTGPPPDKQSAAPPTPLFGPDGIFATGTEVMPIDLPTALQIANSSNPTVAFARAQVDEAYTRVRQAQLMWLPNLDFGAIYLRHDGNIQNSAGVVFDTNKSNLTVFGGPTLKLATADGLFGPLIARRLASAQQAATQAVTNNIQLDVALSYLDLLQTYGLLAINADILARDAEVLRRAKVADRTGLAKTGADLPRVQTEYDLRVQERLFIRGQIRLASSRLARLLLLQPNIGLVPTDPALMPITFIPEDTPIDKLIAQAVQNRPEMMESQALTAVGEMRLRQARLGPLLPQIEMTYYGAEFGGGIDGTMNNYRVRGDGTASMVWTLQNMGLGNLAETRLRRIQLQEANLHVLEVQALVGDQVNQAVQISQVRREALPAAEAAVSRAIEMFRRLDIIAFGMTGKKGELDSVEPLLAVQALSQARNQYLSYIMDYNRAQFQLFNAVGMPPIQAPPQAVAIPLEVSPKPGPYVPPPDKRK